ncbi:MAG TPA: hypothetical protein VH063_06830 [Gaiellaceae bacterium]|jgi:hypothetical protein|nr:hypothetical protein [Gaiellaceae bacterium]
MRRLILLFAVGVSLSVAGIATADNGPTPKTPANVPGFKAHQHWFAGQVTAVGTGSLSVGVLWTGPNDGSLNGTAVTVAVSDHTRINGPHHRAIALGQIQVGDLVAVRGVGIGGDLTNLTAAKIRDFCNCHWVGGTIASITPGATPGTGSFTVAVKRTGPYDTVLDNTTITIGTNALTVYLRGPHHARLGFSDLQVGEGVGVVFSANGFFKAPGFDPTTATFTAKRVHVWPRRFVPPVSSDAADAASTTTS